MPRARWGASASVLCLCLFKLAIFKAASRVGTGLATKIAVKITKLRFNEIVLAARSNERNKAAASTKMQRPKIPEQDSSFVGEALLIA